MIKSPKIKLAMLSLFAVSSFSLTGCGELLPLLTGAEESTSGSSTFSSGNSVGTAKTLQSKADDAANKWDDSAALIKVEGVNIDSSGENDLAGSQWRFLYANSDKSKSYEVIFSRQGMTTQEQGSSSLETIGSYPHDSDDAIPRARTELSIEVADIKKLNMTLTVENGQANWKVDFLDDLGQLSRSTNVTASA